VLVEFVQVGFQVSQRRACQALSYNRSTIRYQSRREPQQALRIRLRDLAAARVHYGYRRLHLLLRREGWMINAKRVYRLYKLEGLSLRLKKARKRVSRLRVVPPRAQRPNERWSVDFVSDRLANGRRFRILTLVDNFSRNSSRVRPALEVDFSLTGRRVVEVLSRLAQEQELPEVIQCDNGTEFTSQALDEWVHRQGIKLDFSRPGKPTDNGSIESFNGKLRAECLDQHWFSSIQEARSSIEAWRQEYNQERPHRSLQGLTPQEFLAQWAEEERAQNAA
jgi:putative transposase